MCNYPSVLSILPFCCMTAFFGVHYSGTHISDEDEDDSNSAEKKSVEQMN
jgi:hypothetical protein